MGGERERAELAAFEALLAKWIANALVAELREEGSKRKMQNYSGGTNGSNLSVIHGKRKGADQSY